MSEVKRNCMLTAPYADKRTKMRNIKIDNKEYDLETLSDEIVLSELLDN